MVSHLGHLGGAFVGLAAGLWVVIPKQRASIHRRRKTGDAIQSYIRRYTKQR